MGEVAKATVEVEVTGHAPKGCRQVTTDLFIPTHPDSDPALWCCVPGGGMNRAYFDLDVPPNVGEFSLARFAAARGQVVLTIDPPGVGDSDSPDDGNELTPRALADTLDFVVGDVRRKLAQGDLEGIPPTSCRVTVGVGHSAGGLLVACQQGRHHSYDAVALPGFSGSGLRPVLTDQEAAFIDRPEALVAVLPELVRARFGDPLPQWPNARSGTAMVGDSDEQVAAASDRASSRLLALVGMTALIPGSTQPELDRIDVPTLVAAGDHDIVGDLAALVGQLPACHDLTLFTLMGSGHNHNVADSRMVLWDRLVRWVGALRPDQPSGREW